MKAVFFFAAVAVLLANLAMPTNTDAADAPKKRPMQIEDLFKFKRVADPQISPDGRFVVYQVGTVDLEANKSSIALWLAATDGKTPPKQLTNAAGKKDTHPRWSPGGKQILFESNRSGSSQLWTIGLDGGEATQLTNISTGASTALWSPDGKNIAFVSSVFAEFSELPFAESDKKNAARDKEIEESPVKARVSTRLFHRHWDEHVVEGKRQHIFVISADGKDCRDVTPGDRDAYPTSTTFSVGDDFTFTPDSKHIVFTAVPAEKEAWSTNHDLCRVSIDLPSGGRKPPVVWEALTADNKAADCSPRFLPFDKFPKLAWRRQKKAGYEADKWELVVSECNLDGTLKGKSWLISEKADRSVNEFAWTTSEFLFYTADSKGGSPIFNAAWTGIEFSTPNGGEGTYSSITTANKKLAFLRGEMNGPGEVYVAESGENLQLVQPLNLSHANDALLAELDLAKPEAAKVKIEDGDMQMWILKPPGFDDKRKWPVVYLIHGGPQGAWEDGWSYRWNPQLWAAQGYVVVMPNPRGSTGFGQKFVDEISGDWGGKCYRDLVAGLEHVKKLPYVDKDRIASAGASFGGYMQNWFAVNDIAKDLKCQISHCSVWNFESMWGTTDELWFDEWEHQSLPWEKPGKYAEFSPHKRAGELGRNKVPMLVIHNDLDFRCPIGQGHELFTSLQRQGVPSKLVNFPDEGHWVLKPKNSQFWHREVFAWLTKYCPPGGK